MTVSPLSQAFARRFDGPPAFVARAPGRVNLIGEHTDYNEGFVLPMAIDRWITIALRPRADRRMVVASLDFGETEEADLGAPRPVGRGWMEYVKGVAWALQKDGQAIRGWEGVIAGDVPMGAGLSSSAALEMAAARAFAAASGLEWEPLRMARAGQRAENEWVGVRCGIMDQIASAAGREGHALLIDCRSLETSAVRLPPEAAVAVLDTATRRGLVDSEYNERRAQCERAARLLGSSSLRDVSASRLEAGSQLLLDETTRRRARHVVTESARTLRAAEALRRGDTLEMGRLMNESHTSLREDFQVSSPALDAMAASAQQAPGAFGARLTGAGFGGCVVALVRSELLGEFAAAVRDSYAKETGLAAKIHTCRATNGAELVHP